MNTFLEILAWNAALAATCYGVIRFVDYVIKPWLEELATADHDPAALDEYVIRSALTGKYTDAEIEATIARARGQ
ncbi:hypothetical protein [Ruixingdingia sedimenti]|uniref:Uncharacterized protein n=1 Tax=Ruixingdingia sedimenti TaxID=3073604 RepID=A0ABU1FEI5_9RHOB|nr:hypothetical protein [Xinfangfangia sp. LG-4]MDR5655302.1 hypothetical protein [Xinfangfangia sp. LG-4]